MLFFVSILFHYTRKIWKDKGVSYQIIILCLLFVCQMGIYPLQNMTASLTAIKLFKNVTDWLPVYYMGILIVENKLFINKNNLRVCILLLSLLLYAILIACNAKSEYLSIPHCFLFISIYLFLANTKMQSSWARIKISRLLDKLAKYSLGIYVIHHLLIYDSLRNIKACRILVNECGSFGPLLIFVFVMPLSYLLVKLISRSRFSEYIIGVK